MKYFQGSNMNFLEMSNRFEVRELKEKLDFQSQCDESNSTYQFSCIKTNKGLMIYEKTLLGRMGKDDEHSLISRWTNQADVDWDDNLIEDLRSPYKSPVVHSLMSTFKYFQVVIHSNDTLKLTLTFPNNEDSTSSSWFHSSNLYQVYGPTDNNTLPLELNNVKINYHIDTFHMLGESNTDRQLAWIETYCGCECDPVMIGIFGTDDICIPYFFYDNPNPSNFSIIYSPGPGPTDRNKFLLAEHLSIVGLT